MFSISIALVGGVIWTKWGYQMVFVLGAVIAQVNLVSAQFIQIPRKQEPDGPTENLFSDARAASIVSVSLERADKI